MFLYSASYVPLSVTLHSNLRLTCGDLADRLLRSGQAFTAIRYDEGLPMEDKHIRMDSSNLANDLLVAKGQKKATSIQVQDSSSLCCQSPQSFVSS